MKCGKCIWIKEVLGWEVFNIRDKLMIKILYYDVVSGMIPAVLLFFVQYAIFTRNRATIPIFLIFLMCISAMIVFSLLATFLKTKLVAHPMNVMIHSIEQYRKTNQLKAINQFSFAEANVLGESIGELLSSIKERDLALSQSQKLKMVGEISSTLSHEIRNPLTTIKGTFQLLQAKKGDKELFDKFAPVLISEIDRMNQIVEKLLDFSRSMEIALQPYDLKAIMDEILLMQTVEFEKKHIIVDNQMSDFMSVYTDKNRLTQVIVNMIRNANESFEEKGGVIELSSSTSCDGFVYLVIKDDGRGISKDDIAKIGTPYFTTKSNGNGLGFATSVKIMNELYGQIDIKSVEKQGTTITLKIPESVTITQTHVVAG